MASPEGVNPRASQFRGVLGGAWGCEQEASSSSVPAREPSGTVGPLCRGRESPGY